MPRAFVVQADRARSIWGPVYHQMSRDGADTNTHMGGLYSSWAAVTKYCGPRVSIEAFFFVMIVRC